MNGTPMITRRRLIATAIAAAGTKWLAPVSFAQTSALAANQNLQPWDVRQFGAKGDGKTLDTRAVQATIDCLPSSRRRSYPFCNRMHLPDWHHLSQGSCRVAPRYQLRPPGQRRSRGLRQRRWPQPIFPGNHRSLPDIRQGLAWTSVSEATAPSSGTPRTTSPRLRGRTPGPAKSGRC